MTAPTTSSVAPRAAGRRRHSHSHQHNTDGALCYYLDAAGRQHFNFAQQVWLQARVPMAFTPTMSVALETLAINLLTQVTRQRDYPAAVGVTSRRVVRLARRFCAECLLTARAEGWEMPRSTLRAWLSARSRCSPAMRTGANQRR